MDRVTLGSDATADRKMRIWHHPASYSRVDPRSEGTKGRINFKHELCLKRDLGSADTMGPLASPRAMHTVAHDDMSISTRQTEKLS